MTDRISIDSNELGWRPAADEFPGYALDTEDRDAGIFVKVLRRPDDGGGCWHCLLRFRPPEGKAIRITAVAQSDEEVFMLDGRALPASRLASEAGIAASTASGHLNVLLDGGAVTVEQSGRHRYYRLARPEVAAVVEQLASVAVVAPVRSLRDGTRAQALRLARTCYDHLAGRLGVAMLVALVEHGCVRGHDGSFRPGIDPLSSRGADAPYELTAAGKEWLDGLGVVLDDSDRRPLLAHCVDWTEQRHHLAGRVGAALTRRLFDLAWIERGPISRSVIVTERGRAELRDRLGVDTA